LFPISSATSPPFFSVLSFFLVFSPPYPPPFGELFLMVLVVLFSFHLFFGPGFSSPYFPFSCIFPCTRSRSFRFFPVLRGTTVPKWTYSKPVVPLPLFQFLLAGFPLLFLKKSGGIPQYCFCSSFSSQLFSFFLFFFFVPENSHYWILFFLPQGKIRAVIFLFFFLDCSVPGCNWGPLWRLGWSDFKRYLDLFPPPNSSDHPLSCPHGLEFFPHSRLAVFFSFLFFFFFSSFFFFFLLIIFLLSFFFFVLIYVSPFWLLSPLRYPSSFGFPLRPPPFLRILVLS